MVHFINDIVCSVLLEYVQERWCAYEGVRHLRGSVTAARTLTPSFTLRKAQNQNQVYHFYHSRDVRKSSFQCSCLIM